MEPILVFPLLRRIMTVLQVYPTNNRAPPLRCFLLTIYIVFVPIPMIRYTYIYRHDFIEFSLGLCEVLALFLMASKFVAFFVYNDTIKNILDELQEMWIKAYRGGSEAWHKIDQEHQKLTHRNTKIVIGIFFTAACVYMVIPFTLFLIKLIILRDPGDTFTLGLHVDIYGLNFKNNIAIYSSFVVPYILMYLSFAITYGCSTRFIPALMNYAATYLKYVCTEIERFDQNYKTLDDKQKQAAIKDIVKSHQRTLRICQDIETCFHFNFLFQYSINIFYICFILFDLNILLHDLGLLVNLCLFLAAIQSDLVMCSLYGQEMIDESLNVADVVYNIKWYEMDVNTRKAFVLMIQRSHRFAKVTAGKFFDLGYESYRSILSKAFSYYLIIRNLYQN